MKQLYTHALPVVDFFFRLYDLTDPLFHLGITHDDECPRLSMCSAWSRPYFSLE